jgi:hypothetical protein
LLLLDTAKQFLISEGMTEERLSSISTKEIVGQALKARTQKLKEISANLINNK